MSLFKTKDLWSTKCGDEEVHGVNSLCISNFNGHHSIIVGSHSGYLRVFQPLADKISDPSQSEYNATDLLIEIQLPHPIIQVSAGKVVSGSSDTHICILHPRSVNIYTLAIKTGAAKHGDQSCLLLAYEHTLDRSAFSMVVGPFGGAQGRDFICVQTLDGALAFFEQETFSFNRFLPDFLIPGPLSFIPVTDSFVTVSSSWHVESYKYQTLAEAKEGSTAVSGKKILAEWSYNLGEPALDIQVVTLSKDTSFILILGERNLYCLLTNGKLRYMKRLEYSPLCFLAYITDADGRLMTLVVSDTSTLLVYEQTTLRWSAGLEFLPIALGRATLGGGGAEGGIVGALVMLSDSGNLSCVALGTEPSLFVAPPLQSHSVDYKAAALELAQLQKKIKSHNTANSRRLATAALDRELSVTVSIDSTLEPCAFGTADGGRMCRIRVVLDSHIPLSVLQVTFLTAEPITMQPVTHFIASLCGRTEVESFAYVSERGCWPSTLWVPVVTTYLGGGGCPNSSRNLVRLPLTLIVEPCAPAKDAMHKVTLGVAGTVQPLSTLLEGLLGEGFRLAQSTEGVTQQEGEVEGLEEGVSGPEGGVVSVLGARSATRVRLQTDHLPALCIFTEEIVARLAHARGDSKTSPGELTTSSSLPMAELCAAVGEHCSLRVEARHALNSLGLAGTQARTVQRRLLARLKDKTPRAPGCLGELLTETLGSLTTLAVKYQHCQNAIRRSACRLSCLVLLTLELARLSIPSSSAQFEQLAAALTAGMEESQDQGWEESTEAAVTHLLRTTLSRGGGDPSTARPISLSPLDDTARLQRHLSLVLDRLAKQARALPAAPSPIMEGTEDEAAPLVELPIGAQLGENLLAALGNMVVKSETKSELEGPY